MSCNLESRMSLRNNTRRTALASPTTAAKIPPEIRPPARPRLPPAASHYVPAQHPLTAPRPQTRPHRHAAATKTRRN